MSEQDEGHPDPERVEQVRGELAVHTPCCGALVLLRSDEAVPDAVLDPVCPRDGVDWALQLIADENAGSGLRAVWAPPDDKADLHGGEAAVSADGYAWPRRRSSGQSAHTTDPQGCA